jgi:hypothetical protein
MKIWKLISTNLTPNELSNHEIMVEKMVLLDLLWLVGCTFCDSMSPWKRIHITMKTYHFSWLTTYNQKMVFITIKNLKLVNVT